MPVPGVSFDETSPKGEGSWWDFAGGVEGCMQIGMHRLLFGVRPPELCTGSNSKLLFSVTQAMVAVVQ